ncbi:lipocalin/fatty-acid binding family protein [Streptomyces sp. NPDC000594]|uniref:lipocalin/fatty-acid binding family protein n=1 Tax=Streptomyces sp. NPDC000594 TaxID=3154261 RepID=UPI0033325A84
MAIESGKWEMTSSDNYGEYLKAVGVGMIQRNLAEKATPTEELTTGDGPWELSHTTQLKVWKVTFTLGEPFDQVSEDGRTAKSVFAKDGDKLILVQKIGGDQSQVIRDYSPTGMTVTYAAKGITATRVFKRL